MRTYPTEEDKQELEQLKAEDWQIELLKLNPEYVFWGNFEDYMGDKDAGWRSPIELESWSEHIALDALNELVNFYFEVYRKNHLCPTCEGSFYNRQTKQLSEDWYSFNNTQWVGAGNRRFNNLAWQYHLTEVEVNALVEKNRLVDLTHDWRPDKGWVKKKPAYLPTPAEVNEWAKKGLGHDSINKWICVETRAKHLDVWGHCDRCEHGYIYDEPQARVGLQLWFILPRKGASRGVYIENIEQSEIPEVIAYLKEARDRNAVRFAKLD